MARTSKGHLTVASGYASRQGEGTPIEVEVRNEVGARGSTVAVYGIALSHVPVPERTYGSDVFFVKFSRGICSLYFGQTKASDETRLHSLLAIRMSVTGARRFMKSFTEIAIGSAATVEVALRQNGDAEEPFQIQAEPDQMVKLTANFAMAAVSDGEACVDFLNASPFSVVAIATTKKMAIQPIVRVELAATQLLGLLVELRKVVIESHLPVDAVEATP